MSENRKGDKMERSRKRYLYEQKLLALIQDVDYQPKRYIAINEEKSIFLKLYQPNPIDESNPFKNRYENIDSYATLIVQDKLFDISTHLDRDKQIEYLSNVLADYDETNDIEKAIVINTDTFETYAQKINLVDKYLETDYGKGLINDFVEKYQESYERDKKGFIDWLDESDKIKFVDFESNPIKIDFQGIGKKEAHNALLTDACDNAEICNEMRNRIKAEMNVENSKQEVRKRKL